MCIFDKVNKLLEQYIGGQIFFTELDKAVKFDRDILVELTSRSRESGACTIASGEIGLAMHNLGIKVDFLVPGGLRHDPSKINLEPFAKQIKGQHFLFIDDSYFSGKKLHKLSRKKLSVSAVISWALLSLMTVQR